MSPPETLPTLLAERAGVESPALFDRDRVAIVLDGETFVGLIARVDLINHLSLNR